MKVLLSPFLPNFPPSDLWLMLKLRICLEDFLFKMPFFVVVLLK